MADGPELIELVGDVILHVQAVAGDIPTAAILRAQGQAEAILAVQKATAEAMQMLNDACPNDQVIKLKALEAMQKVADGKATKIIIPSEIQGLAGLAAGLTEAAKETK